MRSFCAILNAKRNKIKMTLSFIEYRCPWKWKAEADGCMQLNRYTELNKISKNKTA